MGGREHKLPVPEVDEPRLACQIRGQESLHQRRKRAQLARFRHERLEITLGPEDSVEPGKAHGG
jgi:hypothetical protein